MELITMVAYTAAHATDEVPFRCVACEHLTRHSHEDIIPHLVAAHNLSKDELSIDKDGNVFHCPAPVPPVPSAFGLGLAGCVIQPSERPN